METHVFKGIEVTGANRVVRCFDRKLLNSPFLRMRSENITNIRQIGWQFEKILFPLWEITVAEHDCDVNF